MGAVDRRETRDYEPVPVISTCQVDLLAALWQRDGCVINFVAGFGQLKIEVEGYFAVFGALAHVVKQEAAFTLAGSAWLPGLAAAAKSSRVIHLSALDEPVQASLCALQLR